jgi:hypothetical protein
MARDPKAVEVVDGRLAALRLAAAKARNPPPPPPQPEPLPPVSVDYVEAVAPPSPGPKPPPGWRCPGTINADRLGASAIYEDRTTRLTLELRGVPASFLRELAFPDDTTSSLLFLALTGYDGITCQVKLDGQAIDVGAASWPSSPAWLVVRVSKGEAAAENPATSAIANARRLCGRVFQSALEGVLDGADGVLLLGATAPVPAAAAELLGGVAAAIQC